MDLPQPRTAGRPRDPGLDVAIRTAAVQLLGEGGLDACALDEVARRAGVGKATIYRRWSSKDELVVDALRHAGAFPAPTADQGSLVADSRAHLRALVDALDSPAGRAVRQLLPYAETRPDLAEVLQVVLADEWRTAGTAIVDRAVERGEVAPGAFPELALRAAASLVVQQWLLYLGPVGVDAVADLVDAVVAPYTSRG